MFNVLPGIHPDTLANAPRHSPHLLEERTQDMKMKARHGKGRKEKGEAIARIISEEETAAVVEASTRTFLEHTAKGKAYLTLYRGG